MSRAIPIIGLLIAAAVAGSGCASFHRLRAATGDIEAKQAGRTAETLKAFEAQRNHAQFMAAQARWREGNLQACRTALDELLVRDPSHVDARALLVQVLLSEQKFDVARGYLEQILAERPADARAQHTMGLLLAMQGNDTEALAYYRRASELAPENLDYKLSCTLPEAAGDARLPDGNAPGDCVQTGATDVACDAQSPDGTGARPEVERVLDDARAALEADDLQRARDLLTKAVAMDRDTPGLAIRAAVLALRHRHPELAIFVLQPIAERFGDSAALARTLGTAYYRQGDFQAAQRALEQALSLDNTSGLAYLLMGCTLEKLGQSEAAGANFEQARRLDPRLRLQR